MNSSESAFALHFAIWLHHHTFAMVPSSKHVVFSSCLELEDQIFKYFYWNWVKNCKNALNSIVLFPQCWYIIYPYIHKCICINAFQHKSYNLRQRRKVGMIKESLQAGWGLEEHMRACHQNHDKLPPTASQSLPYHFRWPLNREFIPILQSID